MQRKQYDRNVAVRRVENTRRVQAVHARHGLVQTYQVRIQLRGFFNGIQAVHRFSTNLKICFAVKVQSDKLPDLRAVINDENILWHVQTPYRRWQPKSWRAPEVRWS